MNFSRIKNLIKQNGDKFIMVENGEPEMVIMSFQEYEHLVLNNGKKKSKDDMEYVPWSAREKDKKEEREESEDDFSIPFSANSNKDSFFDDDKNYLSAVSGDEDEDEDEDEYNEDEFFRAVAEEEAREEQKEQKENDAGRKNEFLDDVSPFSMPRNTSALSLEQEKIFAGEEDYIGEHAKDRIVLRDISEESAPAASSDRPRQESGKKNFSEEAELPRIEDIHLSDLPI